MNRLCRMAWVLAAVALVLGAPGPVAAGGGDNPTSVHALGVATLEKQPEIIRMSVTLLAKGPDLEQALSKLDDRGKAAVQEVKKLGAVEDSIKPEDPQVTAAQTDQEATMRRMVVQRMRGGAAKAKAQKKPASVAVSMRLTAEWKVTAENPKDLLVFVSKLDERIKAADLAGAKEFDARTEEEEEEELAETSDYSPFSEPRTSSGTPQFLYVARISDAEHDKLLAEAFAKGRKDAERLARAAGRELGDLQMVSSQGGGSITSAGGMDEFYAMAMSYRGDDSYITRAVTNAKGGLEAITPKMGKVSHRVELSVSFTLK